MLPPLYNPQLQLQLPPNFALSTSSTPVSLFPTSPFSSSLFPRRTKSIPKPFPACRALANTDTRTLPKSAIQRIAEKLRSLGYVEDDSVKNNNSVGCDNPTSPGLASPGQIFVPLPEHLPKYRVGHTLDQSWSTPENPVPIPGSGTAIRKFHELRRGVLEKESAERTEKKESAPTLADLTLPADELKRLRAMGIGLKQKLKIGKAGITEGIVNGIHERWRRSEIVRVKCEDICRLNMKRTHDLLERKTGGLVVWRSGSNIILYRGADYKYPYFLSDYLTNKSSADSSTDVQRNCEEHIEDKRCLVEKSSNEGVHPLLIQGVGSPNRVRFQTTGEMQLVEDADRILEGLGPRFTDWWGYDPLPVDADLLPAVVAGYRRPFRLLPYGVKPKLTNDEMTLLKRLGRPLPCHFALGRNSKLQGLAAAIVKLWEKCEIAKIAVKRGVQNTNSELMAEELKRLTGGILLSRDRDFIVFYRGKDFLPASVSFALEERRRFGIHREKKQANSDSSVSNVQGNTFGDVKNDFQGETVERNDQKLEASAQRKINFAEVAIERTNTKLSVALAKKAQAEELLAKMENEGTLQEPEIDKESITEEERYMLRKVGLRMKPFLLLGRRGVFDGTIENMHLHWKYRELVKIIAGGRSIQNVHSIARTLEAESGGILVAVERVSKGYAIIVYRGKNYRRPGCLRPRTLLNKKEALKRYIEAQRRESLKLHVLKLDKNIDDLKLQLAKSKEIGNRRLPVEVELVLVNEEEKKNNIPGAEYEDLENNYHTCSETEVHEPDCTSLVPNYETNSLRASPPIASEDVIGDCFTYEGNKLEMTESNGFSELVSKGTKFIMDTAVESRALRCTIGSSDGHLDQTSSSDIRNADPNVRDENILDSSPESQNTELPLPFQKSVKKQSEGISLKCARLSNRERLLLRKQALKMKKRPVLAVGKSNIVTGVAKAIKAHFKKYPLAIVNVKGSAEGTSVKELVFKLQQATGAIFVSQEPSKVILYRGWGAGVELHQTNRERPEDLRTRSSNQPLISAELLSAIRLECGLESNQ